MEQMDPVYLAAIDELTKIEGLHKINTCAHFTAKVFGKSLSTVLIDACEQSASQGFVFGKTAAA